MTILVAFASRHGNARGIAETIAAELERRGHHTVFSDVSRITSLDGFDTVVVGSGLRHGRWLPQTLAFLDRFQPELATLPVWIFCSGPLGDAMTVHPRDIRARDDAIRLMDHRCFPGSISPASLQSHQQCTDRETFTDWKAVDEWADRIGDAIHRVPMTATAPAAQGRA